VLPPQQVLQPLQPSRQSQHPPTGKTAAAATVEGAPLVAPVGTAAAPALVPAAGIAAEPNDQPVPVAVAPVKLKKDEKKADHSGRDDNEPRSSREIETEIITQSLSLRRAARHAERFQSPPR